MARSFGQHGEPLTTFLMSLTAVIIGKKASQSLETLHFAGVAAGRERAARAAGLQLYRQIANNALGLSATGRMVDAMNVWRGSGLVSASGRQLRRSGLSLAGGVAGKS
jgi:hypothetical protein